MAARHKTRLVACPRSADAEKGEGSAADTPFDELARATGLTDRERDVAQGLLAGSTQAQIAQALSISASSVATYRSRACEKLGIASLDELDPVTPADGCDVIDVGSPLMPGLLVTGFCGARLLGLLASSFSAANALIILAILALPPAVALAVARARRMRLWTRPSMTPRDEVAALPLADEERCVLYLRGRGLGELEARVVTWIASGAGTPVICERLHVAPGTVNAYRARVYARLDVHSSRELAELPARDVGVVPSAGKNRPPAEGPETSV